MLTPFGIAIRKLRLDKKMRLLDLADALTLSPAFVSAVETGKKVIPEDYINKVAFAMSLDREERRQLERSADQTKTTIRVDRLPAAQREFVAAFARGLDKLPPDLATQIRKIVYESKEGEIPFKRSRRGLLVSGSSTAELREFAEIVRTAFVPPEQIDFPIMDVLEFRLGLYFEGFYIDLCNEDEMEGEEGLVVAGENCIKFREDIYRGAWNDVGRDRFTACHELAHFLLHREVKMARRSDDHPIYRDAEWQADTFAGSLLMSKRHVNQFTGPHDASGRCGMTLLAAAVMLSKHAKEAAM
jgi:transcriptional regulator with XRE-family HTH domain